MHHAPILAGIALGFPLVAGAFALVAAMRQGGEGAAGPLSKGVFVLSGIGLLLMILLPVAAFSGKIALLNAVLLLTGAFAVAGAASGFRASRAIMRPSA